MSERRLVIHAQYGEVAGACAFCAAAAVDAGLDENAVFHVQMAVDEACTNIIEHAYGGEGEGHIALTCRIAPGELTVTIRDHGRAFDPSGVPPPKLGNVVEDVEVGGLGLYFMRQVMDEVHFKFGRNGNELVMVKRGEHAGG
jgi:serine/threonine-protein kinase RsbW